MTSRVFETKDCEVCETAEVRHVIHPTDDDPDIYVEAHTNPHHGMRCDGSSKPGVLTRHA